MIIEIAIAIFLGILAGSITGIAPGIHINLVALLLFVSSSFLLKLTAPLVLAVFIISMAITHSFLDFISGIFLGAPEESTALSILPGHELLLKGKGYEAVKLTSSGCIIGIFLLFIVVPLSIIILPPIYDYIKTAIPFILILSSLFLILREKRWFWAFFLFMLSGILGIAVMNLSVIKQPLFPLLTGLFGTSMLLSSIKQKTKIPKQEITKTIINKKETTKTVFAGVISSFLCAFMPGLGAAQAAVLGNEISGKISQRGFLILLGIISILVTGLNFAALYIIDKPRSGTAIIVGKLLNEITLSNLIIFGIAALISGIAAFFLSLFFAKIFVKNISKVNYPLLSLLVLIALVALSIFISGWISILVLITATSIGLIAIETGTQKMHLMGCIILPVIFFLI